MRIMKRQGLTGSLAGVPRSRFCKRLFCHIEPILQFYTWHSVQIVPNRLGVVLLFDFDNIRLFNFFNDLVLCFVAIHLRLVGLIFLPNLLLCQLRRNSVFQLEVNGLLQTSRFVSRLFIICSVAFLIVLDVLIQVSQVLGSATLNLLQNSGKLAATLCFLPLC